MQPSFVDNGAITFDWEDKYLFNAGNEYRYFNFNNLELNSEYVENIEYHKPYYYIDLVPSKTKYFEPYASAEDINDHPNHINVFIQASMPYRVERVMRKQQITEEEAVKTIKKVDKMRENYVKKYTGLSRYRS